MANSDRLSICFISDDFLPAATGVGTHLQQLSEELSHRGHRICIITTRRPGQPEFEEWRGVNVYRTYTLKLFGFYQALPSRATIKRIVEENQSELIHYHYLGLMLMRGERVGRRLGLPQLYTYHMTAEHLTQPWPMRAFRPLIRRGIIEYCNKFDLVICPSKNLVEHIRTNGVSTPIRYISNPVAFKSAGSVQPAPKPNVFMVLFAGRLDPEKNIPLLLEAFGRVIQAGLNAGLWIAGHGLQRPRLEAMCRSLGIAERVGFLGFIPHDQLATHYAACDVFVLPSLVEVQALVAMEAMHFGKPVILTRAVVCASELVEEGQSGFIVDQGNPDELASRLLDLAADSALRQRLGRTGQQRSLSFSPDSVISETEDAYRKALRESSLQT